MPENPFIGPDGGSPRTVVQPGSPLKRRELEADISQSEASAGASRASAGASAASAETATTLLPARARKEAAAATSAEIKAEKEALALAKLKALQEGRPLGAELEEVTGTLREVIRSAVEARKKSREMFGASGFGHTTTSAIGGFPAATVVGLLENIGSNVGFDRLQEMRKNSPTGGALGNVSNVELGLLKSSLAAISPTMDDEAFQRGLESVIKHYGTVYNKLGGDPYALAETLGADEIDNFKDLVRAYRFLPEDEKALQAYTQKSKGDGTYDPTDFAVLMAQAYQNATGRKPDEDFMRGALDSGIKVAEGKAVPSISYDKADEFVRASAVERAKSTKPETGWGEALGGAALNFVPSVGENLVDIVKGLTVDGPDVMANSYRAITQGLGLEENTPEYDAFKDYFHNRWATEEGFKHSLKTDPAGMVADIAGLFTGGGTLAAKLPGTLGKIGGAVARAGAAMDPVNTAAALTRGGVRAAGVAGDVAVSGVSRLAGVTPNETKQAFSAGQRQSPDFVAQMEGTGNPMDPLTQADKALSELYQQRSSDYKRRMARLKQDEVLSYDDVDDALQGAYNVGRHKGIDISGASGVWDEIYSKVDEFAAAKLDTLEDFDALKRALIGIRSKHQIGTPEYRVAKDAVNALNKTITDKAPHYAKIMNEYRVASDTLADVKASIASGAKSADTTLGKLRRQSAGNGPRGRTVLELLESTRSGKGLGDMLAGQSLSSPDARGLTTMFGSAGAVMGSPEALGALLVSPRAGGRTAYRAGDYAGRAARMGDVAAGSAAGQRLSGLIDKYGSGAAAGVRVANPALIQPTVDPFTFDPQQGEAQRAALIQKYLSPPPTVSMEIAPNVSLGDYREADIPAEAALSLGAFRRPEEEEPAYAKGGRVALSNLSRRYRRAC